MTSVLDVNGDSKENQLGYFGVGLGIRVQGSRWHFRMSLGISDQGAGFEMVL
jgi:hypothetical protein